MRARTALVILFLAAVMLLGCAGLSPEPTFSSWRPLPSVQPLMTILTDTPVVTLTATLTPWPTNTATPSPTPTPATQEARARCALDMIWDHLTTRFPDENWPALPDWGKGGENVLEEGAFSFVSGEWRVRVRAPNMTYHAWVNGPDAFAWTGRVTPGGEIETISLGPTPTPPQVRGWRVTIHSALQDPAHDDYARVLHSGEELGLEGVDANVEAQIMAQRDSGRVALLWGHLDEDATDYGGARLVVHRLALERPTPTPVPESELVEGWTGQIHTASDPRYDDYFESQTPSGRYGVDSFVPRILAQLEAHRDKGTVLRIWGVLDYGVTDLDGKRIIVSRLEIVGE